MRRAGWVGAGVLALAVGWAVAPAVAPLYDGIGFPDEAYRYVDPGPGQATKLQPGLATAEADATGGTNAAGYQIDSGEQGPQVTVFVPAKTLETAAGSTTAAVTATPEAPDAQPADGTITGNVYRLTASSGGQAVGIHENRGGTITLRAPVGFTVIPVIEFRAAAGDAWARLQTSRVGNDIFTAPFERLGDYAAVLPKNGTSATTSGGGVSPLVIVLIAVGGLLVVVLLVRAVRSRAEHPADPA